MRLIAVGMNLCASDSESLKPQQVDNLSVCALRLLDYHTSEILFAFYHTMHCSAKYGLVMACRPSVCNVSEL